MKTIILTDLANIDQQWLTSIKTALNQCDLSIIEVLQFGDDAKTIINTYRAEFLVIVANEIKLDYMQVLIDQASTAGTPVLVFEKQENSAHAIEFSKTILCSYLGGNVHLERLPSILSAAKTRFESFSQVTDELKSLRRQLKDRKDIDRAKGILMRSKKLDEDTAYKQLRTSSMNNGKTIGEMARAIVATQNVLN